MSGSRIALDTNQAIAVLNNSGDAGQWITGFSELFLPIPVIGELRFGALNSQHAEANLSRIEQLVVRCHVLDITLMTVDVYARIRLQLKQKGKLIPENDVWIAAVCLEHDLSLATSDEHFLAVDGLTIIKR